MSYIVHNKRYADYFPKEYAHFYIEGTGPNDCSDCCYYGKIGGIFMGYCVKCARIYKGYRGPGMIDASSIEENKLFFTRKVKICQKKTTKYVYCWIIILFLFLVYFYLF